jgi:lipopolysaccharide export system protein LptC
MSGVVRYTRFVALFKHCLWALVAVMIAIVVWIASDTSGENKARIVFSNIAKSANLQNIMLKPYYQGVDARNRPYTIIAEKATQIDKDNIALTKIHADMLMNNGVWIALNSGTGKLNLQTKQMVLLGGVDMFYNNGYEFRTDHADVDIAKGSAYADSAVEGQGPLGTLKANTVLISDHGKVIHFAGSVKMKLYR